MLLEWVQMTVHDNPHLHKETVAKAPATVAPVAVTVPTARPPVTPVASAPAGPTQTFAVALNQAPAPPTPGETVIRQVEHQTQTLPPPQAPAEQPASTDPFSPSIFNRENHPNR